MFRPSHVMNSGEQSVLPSTRLASAPAHVAVVQDSVSRTNPNQQRGLYRCLHRAAENELSRLVACRATGVRRLVYTSSIHAVAEPPQGTVIDESQPFDPDRILGDYARSMARATLLLLEEVRKGGLDAVICCPTGVIGPWDYGISNIGQLILDFASGYLKSYVSGAYDFVGVRDVAKGLILAAEKGQPGHHYIFSGAQVQVPELMKELERNIGHPAPTYQIPAVIARAAGVLASVYYWLLRRRPVFTAYSIDVLRSNSLVSSARAREALGFTTRPWQESIRDHVEWFRSEGMLPIQR